MLRIDKKICCCKNNSVVFPTPALLGKIKARTKWKKTFLILTNFPICQTADSQQTSLAMAFYFKQAVKSDTARVSSHNQITLPALESKKRRSCEKTTCSHNRLLKTFWKRFLKNLKKLQLNIWKNCRHIFWFWKKIFEKIWKNLWKNFEFCENF